MDRKRRRFMAGFGIALSSFLGLGCQVPVPMTCYAPVEPTPSPGPNDTPVVTCYAPLVPTPTPQQIQTPKVTCYTVVPIATITPTVLVEAGADWRYLRDLWYGLDELASVASDEDEGIEKRDLLISEHEATLANLVNAGAVDPAVAEAMQVAYAEAAFHVWRSNTNLTCYVAPPRPEYTVQGRAELLRQAEVLEELAASAAIDADTVAEARAAIERDLAYLTMSDAEQDELAQRIIDEAGESGDYPEWEEIELRVSPANAEAARILVQLLLGKQNR